MAKGNYDPIPNVVTKRVILHRNGDPIHFDVTIDFQRVAEQLGHQAEKNVSHKAKVAFGYVVVEHVP
jgi:phage protein U